MNNLFFEKIMSLLLACCQQNDNIQFIICVLFQMTLTIYQIHDSFSLQKTWKQTMLVCALK